MRPGPRTHPNDGTSPAGVARFHDTPARTLKSQDNSRATTPERHAVSNDCGRFRVWCGYRQALRRSARRHRRKFSGGCHIAGSQRRARSPAWPRQRRSSETFAVELAAIAGSAAPPASWCSRSSSSAAAPPELAAIAGSAARPVSWCSRSSSPTTAQLAAIAGLEVELGRAAIAGVAVVELAARSPRATAGDRGRRRRCSARSVARARPRRRATACRSPAARAVLARPLERSAAPPVDTLRRARARHGGRLHTRRAGDAGRARGNGRGPVVHTPAGPSSICIFVAKALPHPTLEVPPAKKANGPLVSPLSQWLRQHVVTTRNVPVFKNPVHFSTAVWPPFSTLGVHVPLAAVSASLDAGEASWDGELVPGSSACAAWEVTSDSASIGSCAIQAAMLHANISPIAIFIAFLLHP